jgi:hypothetical protein
MRLAYVCLFVVVVLGCQAPTASISPTDVVASPVAIVDSPAAVAAGQISVWGEVPKQCA